MKLVSCTKGHKLCMHVSQSVKLNRKLIGHHKKGNVITSCPNLNASTVHCGVQKGKFEWQYQKANLRKFSDARLHGFYKLSHSIAPYYLLDTLIINRAHHSSRQCFIQPVFPSCLSVLLCFVLSRIGQSKIQLRSYF